MVSVSAPASRSSLVCVPVLTSLQCWTVVEKNRPKRLFPSKLLWSWYSIMATEMLRQFSWTNITPQCKCKYHSVWRNSWGRCLQNYTEERKRERGRSTEFHWTFLFCKDLLCPSHSHLLSPVSSVSHNSAAEGFREDHSQASLRREMADSDKYCCIFNIYPFAQRRQGI